MTSNGFVPSAVRIDSPLSVEVEAYFRFLGVDVHVVCDSVRQLQYWEAVYAAFTRHPTPHPDVTIRTHGDASAGSLSAIISTDDAAIDWRSRGQLLPPLDLPLFDRWVHLQGTILARAGHGVLLIGAPGAGKTMLALAGVTRGALLVADGVVPLAVDDLLAHPFPRSLRLRRTDLELLGIPFSHPALRPFRTRDGEVQWRADPRALLGTRSSRTATEVAAIVVMSSPADGPATLHPVLPEDGVVALLRHLHVRPVQRRTALDALIRLAQGVPSYVLRPGPPRATAQLLDQLLA